MRLADKVAIVTGGGSGIGRAAALLFAREGASVLVADIEGDAAGRTAAAIEAAGGRTSSFRLDVSKAAEAEALTAACVERYGRLDVLINNAGVTDSSLAPGHAPGLYDEAIWARLLEINLSGMFLVAKYAVPELSRRGGAMVNTASSAAFLPLASHAYAASKAGVVSLTRTLALELVGKRVRVNAVAPGPIETPLSRGARSGLSEKDQAARAALLADMTPMGIGQPENIAHAMLFLASDEASFITGQVLLVDGGQGLRAGR